MIPPLPQVKDLVLVGGGHAHVNVLKSFAMRPVHGLRITLISREVDTPYSGMLPGHVHGAYSTSDVHINLLRLARFTGARLFIDEVTSIDPDSKLLRFGDGRELRYDLLSINTGAAPNCPFDHPHVVPVKPIGLFLPGWHALKERLSKGSRLAVVGGGAGGFEIALAAQHQLADLSVTVSLLTSGKLLPDKVERVRLLGENALRDANIELRENFRVGEVNADALVSNDGEVLPAAGVLWVTGVAAPGWLANTGLARDQAGFIEVDNYLRSVSHDSVYAAGDVAGMRDQPRPKSGVFAVRQGPKLARNLRAAALEEPARAKPYKAQSRFLALLNCADGTAIASYGSFAARHKIFWRLKHWIDSAFMTKFNVLPVMQPGAAPEAYDELRSDELGDAMRCGGCGSKINASLLNRVLRDVEAVDAPWVLQGIGDDAAVLDVQQSPMVITTDGFRSMVDDTRLLGRVAAHHALSDVYAMGATPSAVLLSATLPLMSEAMMEAELRDLLAGVQSVLREENVPLVGGHTAEGAELSVNVTVTGTLGEAAPLGKVAGKVGDVLVLTKGLGSGCILAAAMRGDCETKIWRNCLAALDTSNRSAAKIIRSHEASACTDVTGFGFAGHLFEMLGGESSELGAQVHLNQVPELLGAKSVLERGITSSLQSANATALAAFEIAPELAGSAGVALLADPQTAGGLLAAIPAEHASRCVESLRHAGYTQAAAVGKLTDGASRVVA